MLLVIFDTEFDHVNYKAPQDLKWVLDFTYQCQKEYFSDKIGLITPDKIDNSNLHEKAVTKYVDIISKVSETKLKNNETLRSIEFDGLPLYWLTKISIKHAQQSICKNIFYLFELLQNSILSNYQLKDVIISLPKKEYYYDNILKRELKARFNIDSSFIKTSDQTPIFANWSDLSFLKNLYNTLSQGRTHCDQFITSSKPNAQFSFFTFPLSTWIEDGSYDYVYKDTIDFIKSKCAVNYIPYFVSSEVLFKTKKWDASWEQELPKYYPSRLQTLRFCLNLRALVKSVKKIFFTDKEYHFIDEKLIKLEMLNVLYLNNWLLFYRVWILNFIKGNLKTKRNFIYQDEFYEGGRVLSSLVNEPNSFVKTYGFQHGLFFSGHTVYRITDSEIGGENHMPVPNKFIVWGEYFKEEFLKYNSLNANYVIVGCNNKYYNKLAQSKNISIEPHSIDDSRNILVCTTVESDTKYMLKMIFEYPDKLQKHKFIFRTHPMYDLRNYITQYLFKSNFDNYSFSNEKDIFEDIAKSEVMVSSNASTTFLDGMIGNIPVLNIVLPDYQIDDFTFPGLYQIRNSDEFSSKLHEVTSNRKSENNNLEEFVGNPLNWDTFLSEN